MKNKIEIHCNVNGYTLIDFGLFAGGKTIKIDEELWNKFVLKKREFEELYLEIEKEMK